MVDVTMAIPSEGKAPRDPNKIRISGAAQKSVLSYAKSILTINQKNAELFDKMEIIDQAYARFSQEKMGGTDGSGVDGAVACDIFEKDNITPPVVVAQVDTAVAYLAEVFLSGSPIFPVVSNPAKRLYAEQLETLFDDHARIGGYARQFLMFLRDAVKYNYAPIECSWESIQQFSVLADVNAGNGKKVNREAKFFNQIKRLDPYNTIRDPDVAPGDIAAIGDYAGYVDDISYIKLKRMLQRLGDQGTVYNFQESLNSNIETVYTSAGTGWYREPPTISEYISPNKKSSNSVDWDAFMSGGQAAGSPRRNKSAGKRFEVFTFYARIIPSEFGITVPQQNTPQIWKFITVNDQYVVYAERIVSAYDYIPIFFGQPLEDGLGYQTQSIAEGEIPFQEGAGKLFNIRFAASRRAVADRALYLPELVKPSDVNSKVAAAKIPVNIPAMSTKTLDSAYKQIPFDMRGTETTITDAQQMIAFSQQLHGQNNARQGMFQKGNKSVKEWDDTMGSSDGRSRLLALTLEYQVFGPMKDFMLLNIYQYGNNAQIVSQRTGETIDVNIDELRKQVLAFRIADGYTPKSKLASTDAVASGLQMIQQSPMLQQAYGMMLPSMFAHLMSLMGVRGLEEYNPQVASAINAKGDAGITNAMQTNGLQAAPTASLPAPNGMQAPMPQGPQMDPAATMQQPGIAQ